MSTGDRARSVALIRSVQVDEDAQRLERELRPYFGDHLFFMLDRYQDADSPALAVDGAEIRVGGRFLAEHGLPSFPKVGWQCGDFMYYAATTALPGYDYYWLIEPDVGLRVDVPDFFARLDSTPDDLLIARLGPASSDWWWHRTLAGKVDGEIRSAFFPVSRISRRAALHAFQARREYSALPDVYRETWAAGRPQLYANDEVFLATSVASAGFVVRALEDLAPGVFAGNYTYDMPTHVDELEHLSNQVVHPVAGDGRTRARFRKLARDRDRNAVRLRARMAEIADRLGPDRVAEVTGLTHDLDPAPDWQGTAHNEATAQSEILASELRLLLASPPAPAQLLGVDAVGGRAICDFVVDGHRIAFPVRVGPAGRRYLVDAFVRGREDLGVLARAQRPPKSLLGRRRREPANPIKRLRVAEIPLDQPDAAAAISLQIFDVLRRIATG